MFSFRHRNGLVLGLFTLLALALTWPLVRTITTHVPGTDTWAYDEYTFIWSMWHFQHSLLNADSAIFFSQNIFYPLGMELILYSYNLLAAILALPLGLATNWAFAANITLLFSTILSGFGAYLLALWVLGAEIRGRGRRDGDETPTSNNTQYSISNIHLAAILAGLIYAFASNRMIYLAMGHYNIQSWQFLPFFVLYLLRTMDRPTRHNIIMAGLFGALNLLVDMQFGVFMAFMGLCLLFSKPISRLLFRRPSDGRPHNAKRWLALVAIAAIAVALTLPYFWETVKSFFNADYLLAGWGDALKLSADLAGWFTPTALHPLWGTDWVARLRAVQEGVAPFKDVNTVFLGFATLLLALIGAVVLWRKRMRGWIWATIVSALFTLGPLLQIYGQTLYDFDGLESSVPMPFLLLHYIPFVKGNRTANRWSIVLMLALAMLAAWGIYTIVCWASRRMDGRKVGDRKGTPLPISGLIAILLAAFILFEHAAVPLPLTDARIPQAVQALAGQPTGAILQIPMGWRNSFGVLGTERTQAQYYMSAHEMPILSGNTSRNPPIKFDYFARLPFVQAITRQEFGEAPDTVTLAAAQAQSDDLINLWGVRYIMLLPPVPGRYPYADNWQASQQLALDLMPHSAEPIIDDGSIRIYAVEPDEPLPLDLDFGSTITDAWRGDGWSADEPDVGNASGIWATKKRAHLLFRSEDESLRTLTLRAQPFSWPDAPAQIFTVVLNDDQVGGVTMADGWQEYTFELRPEVGINHLWLEFDRAESPRTVLNQAMIGTTGIQSPLNIDIHAFDQAFITLTDADGTQTDASFGRRGYNVTLLDAGSGEILDQQGFDTVANAFEVQSLVDYLNGLPDSRIVLLATREGAGDFVSPDLVTALQRLGSGITNPDHLIGQAHALAGVVGAGQGSAAETIDPADAFLRVAGDYRTLAAALDWLKIE